MAATVMELYGSKVFNEHEMRERLPFGCGPGLPGPYGVYFSIRNPMYVCLLLFNPKRTESLST